MNIAQLKEMPVKSKVGGFELSVKTFKKNFQIKDIWFQQVILMDETGEITADVKTGKKYKPLRGHGNKIKIIVCEIQESEYMNKPCKKLYVEQHTTPTSTVDEYEAEQDSLSLKWDKEIAGKIRHGVVCSYIRAGNTISNADKEIIEALVGYIKTGE